MSRKTSTRQARERSDSGNYVMPGIGLGKIGEMSGLATAATAAAFGVLQANEAYARMFNEKLVDFKSPDLKSDKTVAEDRSDHAHKDPAAIDHQQHDPVGQAEGVFSTAHQASAEIVKIHSVPAPGNPSEHAAEAVPAAADGNELVQHVADHMANSISSILDDAAKGGLSADHIQDLAQNIVQTATSIVDGLREQLDAGSAHAAINDLANNVVSTADGLAENINGQVASLVETSGVVDLLDGNLGLSVLDQTPLNEIVSGLSGLPRALSSDVTELTSIASELPASILGGEDATGGPLTHIFYDDGGGLSDVAQTVASLPIIADIGFAGQPLSVGEDAAGMLHGVNALNLV